LDELRAGRKLRVAVDFAGTTLKTVRRHKLRDAARLGAGHPDTLGELIRAAVEHHREAKRRGEVRRAADRELARYRERRVEHARAAAVARWHGSTR
jgi:hypothetical protein